MIDRAAELLTRIIELQALTASSTVTDRRIRDAVFPDHIGNPPPYTYKIDKALLLVPPGYCWAVYSDGVAGCQPEQNDGCDWCPHHGATPAIAICVAALTARYDAEMAEVAKCAS